MDPSRLFPRRRIAAAALLAACLGCAHVPQQSEEAKNARIEASTAELRLRVVELGREAMREVEIAADSIDAGDADARFRRNTLLWKLSTVSAASEAVLRENPVHAMVDLYAFRLQLDGFLASPAGSAAFGADVVVGRRAVARFARRWEDVADQVGAEFDAEHRAEVQRWADAHPLGPLPFTRAAVIGELALTLRVRDASFVASVGGIQNTLDRLEHRASLLNEYAIKQGLWISQYAALEVRTTPEASELTRTLAGTRNLVETAPGLVADERATILADVERQRLETLTALAGERAILLQALADERALILDAVNTERILTMQGADSLRVRVAADAMRVVDHLMLRVAELAGALLVVSALGLHFLRRTA